MIKWLSKYIGVIVTVLMIASIIGLLISVSAKSKKLKQAKAEIEMLQQQQDSLVSLTKTLAGMDAVRCSVTIQVKNTAVLGSVKTGDLNANIEQIATYTRQQLMDSLITRQSK